MLHYLPYRWRRILSKGIGSFRLSRKRLVFKFQFVKDDLYDFSRLATPWLRGFSILLTLSVFVSLLLPLMLGSEHESVLLVRYVDQFLLIAFGVYFYLKLFVSLERNAYLKSRWPEGIIATIALFFGLELALTEDNAILQILTEMGLPNADQTLLILIQIYLLIIVGVKTVQALPRILEKSKNPSRLVLFSFLLVIVLGTMLLMLPGATHDGQGLDFINALFMATSAVCVTGLIVVDTATHLTMFGQGVILVLIQLGGIGIITFATFLALYISGGININERNLLKEVISGENINTISQTMRRIVMLTFSVEFIGFLGFYFSWMNLIPDTGERAWFALFHSVSAFCNAGFSVFTNSLADNMNATNLPVNITTMVLVILGGLGFTTISESIQRLNRTHARKPFSLHSIIVLRMTLFLILTGAVLVLIIEWNHVLEGYTVSEKILLATFQSVTSRTAGFNTLDTGALSAGATMVVIILMVIGASPSSTAGGLKTTTVYVLYKAVITNITGKNRVDISGRTLPSAVIFRAITAVFLAFVFMAAGTLLLSITESFSFLDILFEQISAFMTVGLSRGITGDLSDPGKMIIIASMFAGRVGMLTLAVAFIQKSDNRNYSYPEESVMVA